MTGLPTSHIYTLQFTAWSQLRIRLTASQQNINLQNIQFGFLWPVQSLAALSVSLCSSFTLCKCTHSSKLCFAKIIDGCYFLSCQIIKVKAICLRPFFSDYCDHYYNHIVQSTTYWPTPIRCPDVYFSQMFTWMLPMFLLIYRKTDVLQTYLTRNGSITMLAGGFRAICNATHPLFCLGFGIFTFNHIQYRWHLHQKCCALSDIPAKNRLA